MEDTLRYFFSAVFQGMAAVITIGAVFVVFKFEEVNRTLTDRFNDLLERVRRLSSVGISIFQVILGGEKFGHLNPRSSKSKQRKVLDEFYEFLSHVLNNQIDKLSEEQKAQYTDKIAHKRDQDVKDSWNNVHEYYDRFYNVERSKKRLINMMAVPSVFSIGIMIISLIGLLLLEFVFKSYLFYLAIFIIAMIAIDFYLILRSVYKTLNFMEE